LHSPPNLQHDHTTLLWNRSRNRQRTKRSSLPTPPERAYSQGITGQDKDIVAEDKEIVAKNVEIAKMKEEIARLQFLDRIYRLCVVDVTALEEELFKERTERVEDVYRANETAREGRKILALHE
jgi:hypothetical protein